MSLDDIENAGIEDRNTRAYEVHKGQHKALLCSSTEMVCALALRRFSLSL